MTETMLGGLSALEQEPTGGAERRGRVLMVHGWWGGAWVWDRFMPRFAERGYHCYAINLRGHHGSKAVADAGKISFGDHLDDLSEAVALLNEPLLLTHSAAGLLSLKLGERVALPACVNLVPVPPSGFIAWRTLRALGRHLPDFVRQRPVMPDKSAIFDWDLNRLPPQEQEEVYSRMVPASGRQGLDMMTVTIDAGRLSGPRLIVSGTDDRLIPPRIHRAMAVKFGAEYREYPGRAHYLMREPGWQDIADDVLTWLSRVIER